MKLAAAILVSAVTFAGPSLACDYHGGVYSGYENEDYETYITERARAEAERERAMDDARRSFLARFDIQSDATPALETAAADQTQFKRIADADRSARPDSQDR